MLLVITASCASDPAAPPAPEAPPITAATAPAGSAAQAGRLVWALQGELRPADGKMGVYSGASVTLSGDTAVVSAIDDNPGGAIPGSVRVFVHRLADGAPCTDAGQCAHFCVDGVCCDAACDGAEMACTAAQKGSGEDGVCGPIHERSYYSCEASPARGASSLALARRRAAAWSRAVAWYARARRRRRPTLPGASRTAPRGPASTRPTRSS